MFQPAAFPAGQFFSPFVVMQHMNEDPGFPGRWNQVRHDLLNLLLEFHNQWNVAFAVSHACGHLQTPSVEKCRESIERTWADIDSLDDMFRRYKATIREMRDIIRETDEARPPKRPA